MSDEITAIRDRIRQLRGESPSVPPKIEEPVITVNQPVAVSQPEDSQGGSNPEQTELLDSYQDSGHASQEEFQADCDVKPSVTINPDAEVGMEQIKDEPVSQAGSIPIPEQPAAEKNERKPNQKKKYASMFAAIVLVIAGILFFQGGKKDSAKPASLIDLQPLAVPAAVQKPVSSARIPAASVQTGMSSAKATALTPPVAMLVSPSVAGATSPSPQAPPAAPAAKVDPAEAIKAALQQRSQGNVKPKDISPVSVPVPKVVAPPKQAPVAQFNQPNPALVEKKAVKPGIVKAKTAPKAQPAVKTVKTETRPVVTKVEKKHSVKKTTKPVEKVETTKKAEVVKAAEQSYDDLVNQLKKAQELK